MDVFSWSMPFVAEKVTKMFFDILAKTNMSSDADSLTDVNLEDMVVKKKKRDINVLKNKIKFVSKMAKMQKILREENENIIKIKVE
jgi:serine/threonine-protein phosphatase 2B catalytic subunit